MKPTRRKTTPTEQKPVASALEPEPAEVATKAPDIPATMEELVANVPSLEARQSIVAGANVGYRLVTFTIMLLTAVALIAFGIYRLKHVIELFTLGLLIAMAINPIVAASERRGVRRILSVTALLITLAIGIGAGMASLGPTLVDQSTKFVQDAPARGREMQHRIDRLQRRFPKLQIGEVSQRLQGQAEASLSSLQGAATSILTTSVTTVAESMLVVFMVVFFLVDPKPLVRGMRGLLPDAWQEESERIGQLAVGKVEAWIQGSAILMITIAVCDTIGLMFLGVPFALLWGVLSGLLEIVPTLGPILSAVPPALVALTLPHPITALWVLVLYLAIQQVESNVLVPWIMSNKVSLHPITLLFFLLAMTELLGIFGAIIATPLAAVIKVLYMELYYRRLHGSLPEEEARDPIRIKVLQRFPRRKAEAGSRFPE
ncbi:MAG TPA: AI-2E family transporter [Armatimonadota bacterium]